MLATVQSAVRRLAPAAGGSVRAAAGRWWNFLHVRRVDTLSLKVERAPRVQAPRIQAAFVGSPARRLAGWMDHRDRRRRRCR